MFARAFAEHAARPCLRDGDRTLRYAETLALGRTIIAGLPRPRSLVVLRCSLMLESVAAYVALMVDGHVPLLLEASLAPELAAQIVTAYQPDAVIDPASGIVARPATQPVDLHPDLGLLLTTSGSTGSPKLVRLSANGIALARTNKRTRWRAPGSAAYCYRESSARRLSMLLTGAA